MKPNWNCFDRGEFMTYEEAKNIVLMQDPTFLQRAKNIGRNHSYVCPCCNNGAGKSGTGITKIPNTYSHPKYHCFVCGETGDIFDLAKKSFGLSNQADVFEALYDYYGLDVDNGKKRFHSVHLNTDCKPKLKTKFEEEPLIQYDDQIAYFEKVRRNLDPSYLEKREISKKTQEHYWIGTDYHWKNPMMLKKYEENNWSTSLIKSSPRCIIPTDSKSYLARDIRKEEEIPEAEKKYVKMKYGNTPIFNEKYSSKEDIVFVTEGEIDAISIFEVSGFEATGLGTVSMWKHFATAVIEEQNYSKSQSFILLLDNDASGKKIQAKLKEVLEIAGCLVETPSLGNHKDPNAFLKADRIGFTDMVLSTISKVLEKRGRLPNNTKYCSEAELEI